MKKILVTGGAGYIGSKFALDLVEKKFQVVVVDNLSTGNKKLVPKQCKFFNIDILDENRLKKIFQKYKFDAVFHFAASLSVPESQLKPKKYYLNNVVGTQNLVKLICAFKIKYLIFSSTCAVYGGKNKGAINEKSSFLPESNYGITKLASEVLIKNYAKEFNFKYAILRYFNVVGADKNLKTGQLKSQSLFKNLSKTCLNRSPKINLFGNDFITKDGSAMRDYIDVNDLSDLHYEAYKKLKNKNSFTINCGYGKPYSVKQIIKNFEIVSKKKVKIIYKKRRPGDVEQIYSNTKFLKETFPKWKRKYNLIDSIKLALSWEKKIV